MLQRRGIDEEDYAHLLLVLEDEGLLRDCQGRLNFANPDVQVGWHVHPPPLPCAFPSSPPKTLTPSYSHPFVSLRLHHLDNSLTRHPTSPAPPAQHLTTPLSHLSHTSMQEGVRQSFLSTPEDRRTLHSELATFFEETSRVGGGGEGGGEEGSNGMFGGARELPWQLEQAGQLPRLAACIAQLSTFDMLYTEEHKFDLARYWRVVEGAGELEAGQAYLAAVDSYAFPPGCLVFDLLMRLANFLQENGKLDASERALLAAADACRRSMQMVPLAQSELMLGRLLQRSGRLGESLRLLDHSLSEFERQNGPRDPSVARALVRIGEVHTSAARFDEARAVLQRALSILGEGSSEGGLTAEVLYAMGALHVVQAEGDRVKLEATEEIFLRALAIRESSLGARHPDFATTVNRLGSLYVELDRYADAEECFKWALSVREEKLGPNHSRTLQTLKHMLNMFELEERWRDALDVAQRGLQILRDFPPPPLSSDLTRSKHASGLAKMLLRVGSVQRCAGEQSLRELEEPRPDEAAAFYKAAEATVREAIELMAAGGGDHKAANEELQQLQQLQEEAANAKLRAAEVKGPLPDGWQEATSADGSKFYVHKATKATQLERPVAVASGDEVAKGHRGLIDAAIIFSEY